MMNYNDWLAAVIRCGAAVEPDGSGKLVAHIDGVEIAIYDPKYGGSGMGYFYGAN